MGNFKMNVKVIGLECVAQDEHKWWADMKKLMIVSLS